MDKKNTFIGGLLIVAAFASLYLGQKFAPPPPPAPARPAVVAPADPTADTALLPAAAP